MKEIDDCAVRAAQSSTMNEDRCSVILMIVSEDEKKLQCNVCGLEQLDKNSFSKDEWIKCQQLKTCLNSLYRSSLQKMFVCGKCM
jgi:hypothetical protein